MPPSKTKRKVPAKKKALTKRGRNSGAHRFLTPVSDAIRLFVRAMPPKKAEKKAPAKHKYAAKKKKKGGATRKITRSVGDTISPPRPRG